MIPSSPLYLCPSSSLPLPLPFPSSLSLLSHSPLLLPSLSLSLSLGLRIERKKKLLGIFVHFEYILKVQGLKSDKTLSAFWVHE